MPYSMLSAVKLLPTYGDTMNSCPPKCRLNNLPLVLQTEVQGFLESVYGTLTLPLVLLPSALPNINVFTSDSCLLIM